jgi:adenosyl cobinamide kinase/adenosyl cobinamide phosphate guanylyltransferase
VITLVLGGARSGKSLVAEGLVSRLPPPITYVATVEVGDDADLAGRVQHHRARRPPAWHTVEAGPELAAVLDRLAGTVLVDSLGPWVATWCAAGAAGQGQGAELGAAQAAALCGALVRRRGDAVVVAEEVGLSVHPPTEAGRRFQDALGTVNQAVAACADDVVLVVAGRVLRLDDPGAR